MPDERSPPEAPNGRIAAAEPLPTVAAIRQEWGRLLKRGDRAWTIFGPFAIAVLGDLVNFDSVFTVGAMLMIPGVVAALAYNLLVFRWSSRAARRYDANPSELADSGVR